MRAVPISYKPDSNTEQVEGDGTMEELPRAVAGATPEQLAPALDAEVLRGLRELQMDGESDLVAELADIYLADAPTQIATMREAIALGNTATLRLAAHSLKGSSASLGATHLVALCNEIEELAQAGTVDGTAEKLADVEQELVRVRAALGRPVR